MTYKYKRFGRSSKGEWWFKLYYVNGDGYRVVVESKPYKTKYLAKIDSINRINKIKETPNLGS